MPNLNTESGRKEVQTLLRSMEVPDLTGFDVSSGTFPVTPASAGIGKSYRVTGAGTVNSVEYAVGDIVVSNGTDWIKQGGGPITKEQIGLGNVDNTADSDKPVSIDQQTAIDEAVAAHNADKANPHEVTSSQVDMDVVDLGAVDTLNLEESHFGKLVLAEASNAYGGPPVVPTAPSKDGKIIVKNTGSRVWYYSSGVVIGLEGQPLHDPEGNPMPPFISLIPVGGVREFVYADGKWFVTDRHVGLSGDQTIAGAKTFLASPTVPTATAGDATTKAANTEFVDEAVKKGAFRGCRYENAQGTQQTFPMMQYNPAAACLDVQVFDTDNWFDNTTGKFQPTVAGFYEITCYIDISGSITGLGKNQEAGLTTPPNLTRLLAGADLPPTIVELNGTSDFVSLMVGPSSPVTPPGNAQSCVFQAKLLK